VEKLMSPSGRRGRIYTILDMTKRKDQGREKTNKEKQNMKAETDKNIERTEAKDKRK
jgi:hypothetical protein